MNAPFPSAPISPDEDALTLPESWIAHLHPRRGGGPGARVKIDPAAGEKLRARIQDAAEPIKYALIHTKSEPALVEHVRAYLAGAADPLGAAGLAAVLVQSAGDWGGHEFNPFTDAWVTEHGVVFAARALVELSGIAAPRRRVEDRRAVRLQIVREFPERWWRARQAARRVRALLAAADEPDYRAAEEALAEMRDTPARRIVVSYLLPTRRDWLGECCANRPPTEPASSLGWMLWCSAGSAGMISGLDSWSEMYWYGGDVDVLASAVEGTGTALVPYLETGLTQHYIPDKARKLLLTALAVLPSDEAFRLLLERADQKHARPALMEAMGRFPVRTLRLLASASSTSPKKASLVISALLTQHLAEHPDLVAEVLPTLPEPARKKIELLTGTLERSAEADPGDLPELLVSPPWSRKRAAGKPAVLAGLAPPPPPELVWADGERDTWWKAARLHTYYSGADWKATMGKIISEGQFWYQGALILINGPKDMVRPLLTHWKPDSLWDLEDTLPLVVVRWGLDALPLALRVGRSRPAAAGGALMPYRDVEVARLMADALARLRSARPVATRWFARHGAAAVPLLVPDALGKAGQERRNAEGALLLLKSRIGHDAVVEAAREHGDEAASAVGALLDTDPLLRLPARVPKAGAWAAPELLPQVLLRDRRRALSADATGHLMTMLAMSPPGQEYAGLEVVREVCDPASLAEFGWALFLRWHASGGQSKDAWAFTQLGVVGDDETVRRLTPMIRAWPGEGGHARAVTGLDVLAAIGSDVALMHLHGIAEKLKFKALKSRAREKVEAVAEDLGLTADQLADRLVPDFGLDAGGGLLLDYGPRRFTVGFDEQLKPYVTDQDGKPRKALPKPGAKDDQDLAADSYKRFAALKKDVRTAAAHQIRRMESAMVERRRWSAEEFQKLFASHPLLGHVVRRLVWLAEDGGTTTEFRLAEDGTFADVRDDELKPPAGARIGIAHPLDLADTLAAWAEVFADYEILQPFPQLGRAVHTLTGEERASGRLERFEGRTVTVGEILGLERHGWELAAPQDAGGQGWTTRPLPGDRYLVIHLDPGLSAGAAAALYPEQTLERVVLGDHPSAFHPGEAPAFRFGALDPVTASEVLAELTDLTEKAS